MRTATRCWTAHITSHVSKRVLHSLGTFPMADMKIFVGLNREIKQNQNYKEYQKSEILSIPIKLSNDVPNSNTHTSV